MLRSLSLFVAGAALSGCNPELYRVSPGDPLLEHHCFDSVEELTATPRSVTEFIIAHNGRVEDVTGHNPCQE